ncbi:hypothetical protein OCK74_09600 [Chitinophagaceae bacterium LB-8]|uniref:Outer membrane protein beta-barrel domain-containing protein n=1 Tax=Paraflavisolibacter caeni TaxID=2982496 RepID=A0A9X3BHY1_9BACT|nr:hypothetical protein [Paraflavisolibacter caeni]MCU7549368.1 hypothetical protein [Paraflavisolibacter caeni]
MLRRKNLLANYLISLLLVGGSLKARAQDNIEQTTASPNNINIYVGFVDLNVNYERRILNKQKSSSKIRLGFGSGSFLTAGEGKYINPAFVHLIGKKINSHLEIDLGFKYMLTNTISDPKFSETFIPDLFLGYRFEKSTTGFVFRLGINYPTLVNAGIGYKF